MSHASNGPGAWGYVESTLNTSKHVIECHSLRFDVIAGLRQPNRWMRDHFGRKQKLYGLHKEKLSVQATFGDFGLFLFLLFSSVAMQIVVNPSKTSSSVDTLSILSLQILEDNGANLKIDHICVNAVEYPSYLMSRAMHHACDSENCSSVVKTRDILPSFQ